MYFIVFKLQEGQRIHAYTFADEQSFKDLKKQKVILWSKDVEDKAIHDVEEVESYMKEFKEAHGIN